MFQWWPTCIQDGVYFITLWLAPLECLTLKHAYRHRNYAPILSRTRDNVENLSWMAVILKSRMAADKRKSQRGKLPIMILEIRRNILVPLPASQLRHVSTFGRQKLIKQPYILHMSSRYGELRTTNGWDQLTSLGHHSKFQRVSRVGFVTAPTALTVSWADTLYIHFEGCCHLTEFSQVQNSLCFQVLRSHIGSVTARHSSSGRQPKFAVWYHRATNAKEEEAHS